MTANTARRLRTAIMIMMVCIPVSLCYEFIESVIDEEVEGKISFIGLAIGVALATPLTLLEESSFDERMRRLPFSVAVLAKPLTYIGSLVVVFQSVGLIVGLMEGRDLKRGLVFNGDVLNTGARIQGECARLGKRLVSSADLFARLTLPDGWTAEDMGSVTLRGKSEPLELVAFGRTEYP